MSSTNNRMFCSQTATKRARFFGTKTKGVEEMLTVSSDDDADDMII